VRASIVIPVLNGAAVLTDCLEALYAHSGDELLEVICVDNASHDESAALIANHYPHARLIRQPINLGFAGGVNAGIEAAAGDVFVLLNQDAVVHPGWLTTLVRALEEYPEFGIAGCTILNPDETVNHAGAAIRRPDAYAVHLTDVGENRPRCVDYVTGAAYAIRRETWDAVGRFDEGYYPAYYEDSDYCYRARCKGIETAYVPEALVTHLSSSRAWQADPMKHAANQHLSRYRFVCKHFEGYELSEFFAAEYGAVEAERYFEQAIGRVIGARDTLRSLPDVLERRKAELDDAVSMTRRRQMQVGFTQVFRASFAASEKLSPPSTTTRFRHEMHSEARPRAVRSVTPAQTRPGDGPSSIVGPGIAPKSRCSTRPSASDYASEEWQDVHRSLEALKQREYDLLNRIYFKLPSLSGVPEPILRRLFRLLVLRPLSFLIGRDYLLLSELNTVHVARMDQLTDQMRLLQDQIDRRLSVLEALTDYDYR